MLAEASAIFSIKLAVDSLVLDGCSVVVVVVASSVVEDGA